MYNVYIVYSVFNVYSVYSVHTHIYDICKEVVGLWLQKSLKEKSIIPDIGASTGFCLIISPYLNTSAIARVKGGPQMSTLNILSTIAKPILK